MKRTVVSVLLLLLVMGTLSVPLAAQAQGTPRISVKSVYTLERYGYAMVNESVFFTNNGTSTVPAPSLTFGVGNLSSDVAVYSLSGSSGFTLATPASKGGPYTISGGQVPADGNSSYVLSLVLDGVVSTTKNGTLQVLTLSSPSIGTKVDSLLNVVSMPTSTAFKSSPVGLTASLSGSNNNYTSQSSDVAPAAVTSVRPIQSSSAQDFNPLHVYRVVRTITVSASGTPLVTERIDFQNMGTTTMSYLYVNLLAGAGTRVTVLPGKEPPLTSPLTLSLVSGGGITLSYFASGYPSSGVQAGANFTITYQYPLGTKYYSASGGQVTLNIPDAPPLKAFVDSYSLVLSLPQGTSASQSAPTTLSNVVPSQGGTTKFTYGLGFGWGIDAGIPAASVIFVLLLVGLFVSRTTTAEAEEAEEEETSTESATDMVNAFDEKTNLINSLWPEIEGKDPNEVDKAFFDELRGRLDSFRSRALQRLNEVKQKSASQKFLETVNQMQATEREVDRAAKDKLNLYQQYYLKQMRKEVYDRLLPQYTKRLEKALNQLSDELHTVQRESKLL